MYKRAYMYTGSNTLSDTARLAYTQRIKTLKLPVQGTRRELKLTCTQGINTYMYTGSNKLSGTVRLAYTQGIKTYMHTGSNTLSGTVRPGYTQGIDSRSRT